jgi:hypothetical protein
MRQCGRQRKRQRIKRRNKLGKIERREKDIKR